MLDHLRKLFSHMIWADDCVLAAIRSAPTEKVSEECLDLYAHLIASESVWLARMQGEPPESAVWPKLSIDEIAAMSEKTRVAYQAFIASLVGPVAAQAIHYTNSAGQNFTTRIEDILLHVVLHGSYHRGQIALLMREAGAAPAHTDYIAFVRGAPAAKRGAVPSK